MKSKTVILMVVAVGCGLVASFLTSRLLADRGPAGPEMVKRLVAKKNLALGTVIKDPERYFVEKDFPVDSAPRKGFESFDAIKNKKLTKPISEDAPITNDDVLEGAGGSFAQAIPPGCEAVAIKVSPELIAGGFVQPMDKVNVIWTFRNGDASQSLVILQNMLVLATDLEAGRSAETQAKLATTVTLAAKPEEAQKVALAAQNGELRLSLRKFGDEEISPVKALKLADLIRNRGHQEAGSSEDTEPTRTPGGTGKPVIDVPPSVTPSPTDPKEDDGTAFTQTIINGENRVVVTHRIGGKNDGTADVIKTDPLEGPKPPRQPGPSKPSDSKPKTETAPDSTK